MKNTHHVMILTIGNWYYSMKKQNLYGIVFMILVVKSLLIHIKHLKLNLLKRIHKILITHLTIKDFLYMKTILKKIRILKKFL